MKTPVMKGDKMFELYAEFIGKNEEEIIDDFCLKLKEELIGDLTIDEYSRFRFWKHFTSKELKLLYKDFKNGTNDEYFNYEKFCELLWNKMDDTMPEEIKDIAHSIKFNNIGEA